jgi:hypothetical protein
LITFLGVRDQQWMQTCNDAIMQDYCPNMMLIQFKSKVHLPEAKRAFQQNEDTLRTNKYTNEKHTMNRQKVTFVYYDTWDFHKYLDDVLQGHGYIQILIIEST